MNRHVANAIVIFAMTVTACSLFTRQTAKDVLSVAQVACIIANASLDDAKVKEACGVVDDLAPAMKDVLSSQRAAMAAAAKRSDCK